MKKKYKDFVPKGDPELLMWLIYYRIHFRELAVATIPDLSEAEITIHENEVQQLIEELLEVEYKKKELAGAVIKKDITRKAIIKKIRRMTNRSKTSMTPAPALVAGMGLVCGVQPVNENELKPVLTLKSATREVQLGFENLGLYGVSIFGRYEGEIDWEYLGNGMYSPFIDHRPLRVAGQPEIREYMAMYCTLKGTLGQMSAILQVTFSGR